VNLAGLANDQGRRHRPGDDGADSSSLIGGILLPPRFALATSFNRLAQRFLVSRAGLGCRRLFAISRAAFGLTRPGWPIVLALC
jgi:hypothetical protein